MAWGPKTETGALKEQFAFEDLALRFFSGCLIATSSYILVPPMTEDFNHKHPNKIDYWLLRAKKALPQKE